MGSRNYRAADKAALFSRSLVCYWPDCTVQAVTMVDDAPEIAVDIAHIRAFHIGGARYDETMSDHERNAYPNLILLCRPHHKRVDAREHQYPVELLNDWKIQAEQRYGDVFDTLGSNIWTPESLGQAITSALELRLKKIEDAVSQLAEVDQEAATLMRSLIGELEAVQLEHPLVDPDVAWMLLDAADRLAGLDDSASLLATAASDIGGLEDAASMLAGAADDLGGLEDSAAMLNSAAHQIDSAVSRAQDLNLGEW